MKLLCVQNISCETLGTMKDLLTRDGFTIDLLLAGQDKIPTTASGYCAVIILGGPMAVYDKLDSIEREKKLALNCLSKNIPILGVCLGSQVIAQAIGGNVFKGSKKEIGWGPIELALDSDDSVFRGLTRFLEVFHWHGDTYSLPPEARILARSKDYIQAFQFKNAIGVQFHFEVDTEMIKRWSIEYANEIKSESITPKELIKPALASELARTCQIFCDNFAQMIRECDKSAK